MTQNGRQVSKYSYKFKSKKCILLTIAALFHNKKEKL